MSGRPSIGICVLTWNQREDILSCLRSLAEVDDEGARVVVLDNGSSDGTAEAIAAEHPEAELVVAERNLGFPGGVNRAIDHAFALGCDAAMLLNPDTRVAPDVVAALARALSEHPDAAAVCAKILFADPPDVIWYAGARYDPRRGYNGRHTGFGEPDGPGYDGVRATERACGGAMLIAREAWERIGRFDESLFLYWEDADWSMRARRAGLRIYVAGDARVWHEISTTSGGEGSPDALYYQARNGLVVAERHLPLGPLGTWRRRAVHLGAAAAQGLRGGRGREGLHAVWQGWRDFRAGRTGKRPGGLAARAENDLLR